MNNEDRIIQEIVEIKDYMHENMATKQDLADLKSDLVGQIDGFVKKRGVLEQEHVALCSRVGRLEDRVDRVESLV